MRLRATLRATTIEQYIIFFVSPYIPYGALLAKLLYFVLVARTNLFVPLLKLTKTNLII